MRSDKPLSLLAVLLAGSVALDTAAKAQPAPPPVAPVTAEAGGALWKNYGCYACHGYQAQGAATGPHISLASRPYVAFEALVRRPYGVMPAYSRAVLSEARLRSIYAYLSTASRFDKPEKAR